MSEFDENRDGVFYGLVIRAFNVLTDINVKVTELFNALDGEAVFFRMALHSLGRMDFWGGFSRATLLTEASQLC